MDFLHDLKLDERIENFDLRWVISAGFLQASALAIFFQKYPDFHALLRYGKTAQQKQVSPDTPLAKLVDKFAAIQVPKSWFSHYYVFFTALQWAQGYYIWSQNVATTKFTVIWSLMTLQATRRAIESYTVTKWSEKSKMHITHYFIGLLYYLGISSNCFFGLLEQHEPLLLNWKYYLLIVVFVVFYLDQFLNHRHLASLVKYSVPTFNLFRVVSCAHYFDEIIIYLTILLISFLQKPYTVPDWNFIASWIFVVTNLSVTAYNTWVYYKQKFDDYNTKYAIIPYVL